MQITIARVFGPVQARSAGIVDTRDRAGRGQAGASHGNAKYLALARYFVDRARPPAALYDQEALDRAMTRHVLARVDCRQNSVFLSATHSCTDQREVKDACAPCISTLRYGLAGESGDEA